MAEPSDVIKSTQRSLRRCQDYAPTLGFYAANAFAALPGMLVVFGVDRLIADPEKYLKGRRFALLVNQSSVAANGRYLYEALIAGGYPPVKI